MSTEIAGGRPTGPFKSSMRHRNLDTMHPTRTSPTGPSPYTRHIATFLPLAKLAAWISAVLLLPGIAVGAEPPSEAPAPRALRIALHQGLESADPHASWSYATESVFSSVYDRLVELDDDGIARPGLAEDWQLLNPFHYRFQLRKDVRFHDGTPLTSADVVASLERLQARNSSPLRSRLASVDGIRAVDPWTVDLTLSAKDPLMLKKLAFVAVVPRDAPTTIEHPVGTGPYRWVKQEGTRIHLERVEETHHPKPLEPTVEIWTAVPENERVELLLSGEIDLSEMRSGAIEALEKDPRLWIYSKITPAVFYLGFNFDGLFAHSGLRKAVDLAIDRRAIVDEIFAHYARPAANLAGPGSAGHDATLTPTRRDLERARALVRDAFEGRPARIRLAGGRADFQRAIADQLTEAGFEVEVRTEKWVDLQKTLRSSAYDLYLIGWGNNIKDLCDVCEHLVHTPDQSSGLGGTNYGGSSDGLTDQWISECMTTYEPKRRQELMGLLSSRIAEQSLVVPVAWQMTLYAGLRKLHFEPRVDGKIVPAKVFRE